MAMALYALRSQNLLRASIRVSAALLLHLQGVSNQISNTEKACARAQAPELVDASEKTMVLEQLLDALFARGHKVVFSQFVTMLDVIEDWARECKGWPLCCIDGSTGPLERRAEMNRYQTGGDAPDAQHLFLLSERAGGLGINLTAADTVVFYDQDWNPQMDLQA